MTEPQKAATSSANSKEKSSLLDIDLGKDFLSSWKSMSAVDDGMDFDFGSGAKGKEKTFKFDKMDMDFSLDADFGKLSSFKIDMSDLDISSPPKKSGKSKEGSNDASSRENHRAKRDSFAFKFDFNEFEDFNFESRPTMVDVKSDKNRDRKGSSNISVSGASGDDPTKDADAMEDDTASKLPASGGKATSEIDTQIGIEDPDARNEDGHLKAVINESSPPKPATFEEQEIHGAISPEKESSSDLQETVQERHLSEKISSPEPCAQQVVQNVRSQPLTDNGLPLGTFSDTQEPVGALSRAVSYEGAEQKANATPVDGLVPVSGSSLFENLSANSMLNSPSEEGQPSKSNEENDVLSGNICADDITNSDSHLESTSFTCGIENFAQGAMAIHRSADSTSELHLDSVNSVTSIDELVPEKGRETVVSQSKYFKRQNGGEFKLKQASLSQAKLTSIGSKRICTIKDNTADEKRDLDARDVQSRSKFTCVSRFPKELSRGVTAQARKTQIENAKGLEATRECSSADHVKTGSELPAATVAHDIGVTKELLVSKRSDQNSAQINALRYDVHPSSSSEQASESVSRNFVNPGPPVTSMASVQNVRNIAVGRNRTSPVKADTRTSENSALKFSRAMEAKLKPLSSLVPKDLTSMKNKEQNMEPQGNTMTERTTSFDIKKQTPPTPPLKRKTFEGSAELQKLTPLKRLSPSPSESSFRASQERAVDKQVRSYESSADENARYAICQTARFDISSMEVGTSSPIENDGTIEKAEACSKALEDICNMLKKKHEEAKDILVRAIVNNNNLLMLYHPIYQEKNPHRSEICRIIDDLLAPDMCEQLES